MAATGYTPIQLYYSTTASAVPTAGNLASGELAINITDGKLYFKNNSGTVTLLAGSGGGGPAAGSNTQIQFNNSGVFGASSSLTWDGTYLTAGSIKDSALTSGRVTYAGASGLLTDSANLTFNGTTLTAGGLTTTGTTSTGVLSVTGNTTLGDAAGDTVTINGTITSNLIFTDNTYDIGAAGATRPRNLFLSGSGNVAGTLFKPEGSFIQWNSTGLTGGTNRGIVWADSSNIVYIGAGSGNSTVASFRTNLVEVTGAITSTADSTFAGNVTVGKGGGSVTTNMALGFESLNSNTSGTQNTSVGYQALKSNLTGGWNTALGLVALNANQSGDYNTGLGYVALSGNISGSYNTAVGGSALGSNTSGSQNTAIGYQALLTNQGNSGNVAIGYQAGYSALQSNNNTFVGNQAGYYTNYTAGSVNAYNTFIGAGSGSQVTTGLKNVILGSYNGFNSLDIRTASNYIVLSDGDGNPRQYYDSVGNASLAAAVNPSLNTDLGGSYTLAYGYRGTGLIAYSQTNHIQTVNAYYQGGWKRGGSGPANYLQIAGGSFIFDSTDSGAADSAISWTEVLRVQKDQTVALQGGATSISGTGITFPSTQSASSNANTLDDYEEGTFTPVIAFNNASVGVTYGYQYGTYVKVGKVVTIQIGILLSSKGSSTGSVTITGLPFTATDPGPYGDGAVAISFCSSVTASTPMMALVQRSNAIITLNYTTTATVLNVTDSDVTNNFAIIMGGTYIASA